MKPLHIFTAPVFEDEDKTRTASLLNVILPSVFVVVSLITLVPALTKSGNVQSIVVGAVTAVATLVLWFLMRLGLVRISSTLLSIIVCANVTAAIYFSGRIAALTVCYVVCIIIAGLLLGRWATIASGIVCALALLGLFQAEVAGLFPPIEAEIGWVSPWVIYAGVFVLTAILFNLANRSAHRALVRARDTNRELEAARQSLQERIETEQEQRQQLSRANDEIQDRMAREQEQQESLQSILEQVRKDASDLGAAASEILAATTQQASGATEQASAISQTTTTVDEVKTIAEQSVSRAQQVVDVAQRTVEVSRTGQEAVQDTIDSMARIKTRVEVIAENILALSEQTQQIGEIIDAVNDIASQSNMLALNAAVEAARAGEHGKGFAVVAEEVRDLAERSRQATAQIKAILSDIQGATNATVIATEEGTKDPGRAPGRAGTAGHRPARAGDRRVGTDGHADDRWGAAASHRRGADRSGHAKHQPVDDAEPVQHAADGAVCPAAQRPGPQPEPDRRAVPGPIDSTGQLGPLSKESTMTRKRKECPYLVACPFFNQLSLAASAATLKSWYCKNRFSTCHRHRLKSSGKPVPKNLWPNGTLRS
jgi:methyl-accepting chemotaxis protein